MFNACLNLLLISTLFVSCHARGDGMQVTHSFGGQAMALEIANAYWFQAIGDKLIVLTKDGGSKVTTVTLAQNPASASCRDLLHSGDRMFALLDDGDVVVLDISNATQPRIIQRHKAASLGILPLDLVLVNSWPVVIGNGGCVRLSDGSRLVRCEGTVTGIAMSIDRGIVYVTDRRIFDGDTDEFLGSATELFALDDDANAKIGTIVYSRDLAGETEIGLMTSGLRDIDAINGRLTLKGVSLHMSVLGSRIFLATDVAVYVVRIAPTELRLLRTFDVQGVHDLGVIAANYLAMCGNFGRGVYRIDTDKGGKGNTLFRVERAYGTMSAGKFDQYSVKIPAETGIVHYRFDETVEITDDFSSVVDVPTKAVILGWGAEIDIESGDVVISNSNGLEYQLKLTSRASTVVPISGNFWFGAEDGIYVIGADEKGQLEMMGSVKLSGPIVQLIPQLDGSAAFVAASGFVGIVELVYDVAASEQ
jgi:hypothetical protein